MSRGNFFSIIAVPIAVAFQWGAMLYTLLHYRIDFAQPLSAIPYFHPSTAILFGVTLTVVAACITIFSLALRRYWAYAFRWTLWCSLIYVIAGWSRYDPVQTISFQSVAHSGAANLAVVGYTFLVYQMSQKGPHLLRQSSRIFFGLSVLFMVGVTLSIHVFHDYATTFQLLVMINFQTWALYTAFFLWKERTPAPAIALPD